MPTIITFLPNGEYLQGHIPKKKKGHKEVCVDLSETGRIADMRAAISAPIDLPPPPPVASLQSWEKPGTKYFGRNRSIWTLKENTWDGYVFRCRLQSGECKDVKVQGRGAAFLVKQGLEPFLTEYHEAFNLDCDTYLEASDVMPDAFPPLGLSSVKILAAPRTRKKCIRMTRSMARNIRNGCYLMEQRHGQHNLSFLTLTVPSLSEEGMTAVRANWGKMTNELFKYLRENFKKRTGENIEYVYCTEIQTSRLQSTGIVAPHLHAVLRGRRSRQRSWVFSYLEIRQVWGDIISAYVNESFDTRSLENIQQVQKSAGSYLAKYMGKGVDSEDYPEMRTHWGGMSRNLCRLIRSCSTVWRSDGQGAEYIHRFIDSQDRLLKAALLKTFSRTWIDLGGEPVACDIETKRAYGGVGLWVGSGVLSTTTYCGGVVKVVQFLQCL